MPKFTDFPKKGCSYQRSSFWTKFRLFGSKIVFLDQRSFFEPNITKKTIFAPKEDIWRKNDLRIQKTIFVPETIFGPTRRSLPRSLSGSNIVDLDLKSSFGPNILFLDQISSFWIKNRLSGPKIVFCTKYHQKDDNCSKRRYLAKTILGPKNYIWSKKAFGAKIVF